MTGVEGVAVSRAGLAMTGRIMHAAISFHEKTVLLPMPSRMPLSSITLSVFRHAQQDWIHVPALRVVVRPPRGEPVAALLGLEPLVVGSRGADLLVPDRTISGKHCLLRLTEEGVLLRDLGSKNGLVMAGVRLKEALLIPGAQVMMGQSVLSLELTGPPQQVPLWPEPHFGGALGASVRMRALFAQLHRVATGTETVLLLGESGTGKELLARAIHDASPRRDGPFVVFDCSAVAPSLIEAELFGAVKGAYTGAIQSREGLAEQANGGTLFLDEVGELPLELQPKLLRMLEAREVRPLGGSSVRTVDVRVVAATHRPLREQVSAGSFRQDLYYRLAVIEAHVPPLRERPEDIPLLVERLLASQSPPRTLADLPPHALEMLQAHRWPGNVRELRNAVTRLTLFPSLVSLLPGAEAATAHPSQEEPPLTLREARDAVIQSFERAYIRRHLEENEGNVSAAARRMGISRQMLHRMMVEHGVRAPGHRED
ncbi:sigma 54-interacting transcriptional regulator [Stigmatella aurantiaca]|uniref:sigma 54-interacting transcriptional regulator n=1 Tax=Stigmatella aurantiaca TaxID=41 RepID=UPI001E4EE3A2|nr:sigma 54-interacting transcriptional regulator [Stigmatella aurantiaca]